MTTSDGTGAELAERFSAELRRVSRDDHQMAESTGYIEALLAGRLDLSAYTALLVQLSFVYRLLEDAAEGWRDDPVAGPFVQPDLHRSAALDSDLAFLVGPDWVRRVEPSAATERYCDRLVEAAFGDPVRFVAHHYTRYLGDLSGGQVIGAAARRIYGFDDRGGDAFYRFPDSVAPGAVKVAYRELLDTTDWGPGGRDRMVDEVLVAYRLNTDLLVELGHGSGA
ncbi:MAG TPA: biliverdin-producing heme oxygenase [Acidimicrobiales bacterium]|nr:biliverdin-producing heme oxygenase [Acidimicrobiales bacterium]